MPATKIATCCYCGTRAALVLRGNDRHELSCRGCGAPLHDLKMLPKGARSAPEPATRARRPEPKPTHPRQPHPKARKKNKSKRRKGLGRKIFEELWDVVEDIID